MWVRRAAIRPVPAYAQVPLRALTTVEDELGEDDDQARTQLDDAFTRFERTQPALADRISRALNGPLDETALALGYFLTLAIWLAFDRVFRTDLGEVTETALGSVEEALQLDEQIRLSDPAEAVDSDDVVAMEQPDILSFVHEHVDAALEANADEVDVDDVHGIYHIVLVEVLALSYAVRPPANWAMPVPEFSA
ncbi:Hypothetical protein A7982_09104 [Minicystis rosea]|nr:Hypothetical protein A7982_09104 [Minicystis rosea]